MSETERTALGEFIVGVQDCLATFGLAMIRQGAFTREEIAAAFEETARQQRERPDCADPARQASVQAMAEFFRLPVTTVRDVN